jgi:hypothetical protein
MPLDRQLGRVGTDEPVTIGDPRKPLRSDVGADLEAERVVLAAQRSVGVADGDEYRGTMTAMRKS